jgi:CBS domain-containing protein
MVKHGVHRLICVDAAGKGIGMISGRDVRIAGKIASLDAQHSEEVLNRLASVKVGDAMSRPLRSCSETDTIVEAAKLMRVQNVSSLAIENKQGFVIGIITRSDLLDQLIRIYEPIINTD